jgi:hypothetical protein
MKTIEITDVDSKRVTTLLSMLGRGKWELEGTEILAFAQVQHWVIELSQKMKLSLVAPLTQPKQDDPQPMSTDGKCAPIPVPMPSDGEVIKKKGKHGNK